MIEVEETLTVMVVDGKGRGGKGSRDVFSANVGWEGFKVKMDKSSDDQVSAVNDSLKRGQERNKEECEKAGREG